MNDKKVDLYRAVIVDDNHDTTIGPPEPYTAAAKRAADALTLDVNLSATVEPLP